MNLLSPAFIELNSELKNKSHALNFLVNKLNDKGCLSDKREFFDAVLRREELLSTYCGYNIAIPHAISKAVRKVSFGFCRTVSLEWDKNDDEVKFILILAIPDSNKKEDNLHIDLMSQIASLALEEKVRKSWEEAKSVEEISKTFQ